MAIKNALAMLSVVSSALWDYLISHDPDMNYNSINENTIKAELKQLALKK